MTAFAMAFLPCNGCTSGKNVYVHAPSPGTLGDIKAVAGGSLLLISE
jgi:hypothetical protein